jgi:hypothetical protein
MTTALKCINSFEKTYTLAGFERGIFCSVGGCDDHYTTPPPGLMPIFCRKLAKIAKNGHLS